jgi:hypothetical protein
LGTGILGLVALGNCLAFAQGFTATLSGVVHDGSGSVVPKTTITVKHAETGLTRMAETNINGSFKVPYLPVGPYELIAEKPGFKQLRRATNLSVGVEAEVNLTLDVGDVVEHTTVSEQAPLVNSTLSPTSGLISAQQVKDLPLNGRSFDQLLTLNTGTVNNSSNTFNWTAFSVAGNRPESNRFAINGVDYVGDNATGAFITPSGSSGQLLGVEAVREYNVVGHTYGAEYGKRGGGQITVVTTSGTNQWHGSAFEYLRNSALDARNFFDNTKGVPPFKRNQFGGSLGGPLKKDKAFLFGNYEGFRQRLAVSSVAIVPSAQARQGFLPNASGVYVPVLNLQRGMLPFFRYFPEPTGPELLRDGLPTGTAYFYGNPRQKVREDFGLVRFDYTLSVKDSFSTNHTIDNGERAAPPENPIFVTNTTSISQTVSLQETHVFSPTVLNVAMFGLSRGDGTSETPPLEPFPENLSFLVGGKAGNPGAITIGGGGLTTVAAAIVATNGANPFYNNRRYYTGSDDLCVVKGKHNLRTGVWLQRVEQNQYSSGQANAGTVSYPTLMAFLQDAPTQFIVNPNPIPLYYRSTEAAAYIQDEIKLKPNLTLRLGLRNEMTTGWNEANGHASNYGLDRNGVILTEPFISHSALLENNARALWQPRVAVVWDPTSTGRWAVRAGFGIHHDLQDNLGIRIGANPPFNARLTIQGQPLLSIIPIVAGTQPPPSCTAESQLQPPACSIFAPGGVDPAMRTPTIQQWSLTLERAITQDLMLQLSYVGSESYHLQAAMNRNMARPLVCADPAGCLSGGIRPANQAVRVPQGTTYLPSTPGRRANPFVGPALGWYYVGTSSYHSANVSLAQRSRAGLTFKTNYTFSKVLDINSAISIATQNQPSTILNPFDLKLNRGLASFSLRHQFNANFSYELPFGSGRRFGGAAHGWVGTLIGGWQWNGILNVQSGFPFTPIVGSNSSGTGDTQNPDVPNQNPDFNGSVILGKVEQWFDPKAFSMPLAGTFGNAGRGSFVGPGLTCVDTSLFKKFRINEKWSLQFRAEAFNVFNHANFDTPNSVVFSGNNYSGSAGVITETATTSRQIQFAMKVLF